MADCVNSNTAPSIQSYHRTPLLSIFGRAERRAELCLKGKSDTSFAFNPKLYTGCVLRTLHLLGELLHLPGSKIGRRRKKIRIKDGQACAETGCQVPAVMKCESCRITEIRGAENQFWPQCFHDLSAVNSTIPRDDLVGSFICVFSFHLNRTEQARSFATAEGMPPPLP